LGNLRVLFLATRDITHPGVAGGDINMWECARYLASQGHQVTFLACGYRGAGKEDLLEGIHLVRLGAVRTLWLQTAWHYLRNCRGRYDVVVAEGFGGSRIPRFAPLYVREPIVTEWRQIHEAIFKAQYHPAFVPILNVLERATAALHRNTRVIAYTDEWKHQFPALGFRPQNVFVVPVSIREHWLSTATRALERPPTLVWLGKFRRYKRPDVPISVMPTILQHVPNAKLILAGRHDDHRYEAQLRRLVHHLDLGSSVEFRFDISEAEKEDLLLGARALLMPSAVEGFGIVALEANACGVPVVASTGVPPSVVSDGVNGLRYDTGDLEGLAGQAVTLLTDDEVFNRLSRNGRVFVRNFGWEAAGRKFEEVLLGAVGKGEAAI